MLQFIDCLSVSLSLSLMHIIFGIARESFGSKDKNMCTPGVMHGIVNCVACPYEVATARFVIIWKCEGRYATEISDHRCIRPSFYCVIWNVSVCACVVLTLVFQSRRKSILHVPSGGLQHKQGNMAGHFFSIFLHVEYNPIQYGIECLDLSL